MLSELRIRNFALIENLSVRLGAGLNVLTGETGAGKSIIVGALSLLVGERASAEVVRTGADRAAVEGVFEVAGREDIRVWLDERGLEVDEEILVLKREVAREGRNRVWINGSPSTASSLAEVGSLLVSLHGQHQHQSLLRRDQQREILDAFGGHKVLLEEVAEYHRQLRALEAEIANLEQTRREMLQRADFLRFQVQEIESAAIMAGEEEALEEEARRLSHAEQLTELTTLLLAGLASGRESALAQLSGHRRPLEQLIRIDPSQGELTELFDSAYYALEEISGRLNDYRSLIDHDPKRLNEIGNRQDELFRLRSKYGPELDDVIRTCEEAKAELEQIDGAGWELSELESRRDDMGAKLAASSSALSARRAEAASALAREVNQIIPDLGMEGGRFEASFLPLAEPGPRGAEEVEFRVSLNRGFEPKPIAQVASGGELSRVMLALKAILARLDAVPTLIFDEVDAGIGGKVALKVGEKMQTVATNHQVLAITHLPQIAARAHRHLIVRKEEGAEATSTSVHFLQPDQRIREVARMLGGDPESERSLAHARELLDRGAVEL